jgi:hypothetical protein
MTGEWSRSVVTVGSTLLGVSVGALLQYLGSAAQIKRQQAERARIMLREKLEELSSTIEQFRDGVNTGAMSLLEYSITGKLLEEETGMKKFPRLEMLVRFYAPSLLAELESLREVWGIWGRAVEGLVDARSRKLGDSETRKAMGLVFSGRDEISQRCDGLQSTLVKMLHETLS